MFIVLKLFERFNITIKEYIQIFCIQKSIINDK